MASPIYSKIMDGHDLGMDMILDPNGSLDFSLFYKDLLHLVEKGNVKLAKAIPFTITLRYNHINSNTSYSDITR